MGKFFINLKNKAEVRRQLPTRTCNSSRVPLKASVTRREEIEPQLYCQKDKQRLHARIGENNKRRHKDKEHNNFNA